MSIEVPGRFATMVSIVAAEEAPDATEWLDPAEREIGESIPHGGRRNEWILARVAAKKLAIQLGLCTEPGECVIPTRGVVPDLRIRGVVSALHLSISHSAHLAAAAISAGPVGIDIQVRRPVDPRSRRFFLRDDEEASLGSEDPDELLELWSAKEAALKAGGVRLYREVFLVEDPGLDGRAFTFRAGPTGGRVDTVWLDDRRVVLALARGSS